MNRSVLLLLCLAALASSTPAAAPPSPAKLLHFALTREGDARRGQGLFSSEQRLGCTRCHTVDGSAAKAGPDLLAVGDKYGRRELIEAVLTPSTTIAAGYNSTTVETKAGEEVTGILKQITPAEVALMGADGILVHIPVQEITARRTSEVSLMPEGLAEALTLQEFTDLIEYLVSLKAPAHSAQTHHGMPDHIPMLSRPVQFDPVHPAELRFEHPVWFGPVPGESNVFLVVEQETGKIWRLTGGGSQVKTLFLETAVHDPGARGSLGLAFHPRFVEKRRYYLARQVLVEGQFESVIFEYEASPDLSRDSGRPPRLILRVKGATNGDHVGDMRFGPDGYFYIGMGDTGPGEDPQGHGQNPQVLLGKMLRIDLDRRDPGQAYAIPADNPFVGRAEFRPEIWAYGLREPWRFSFDTVTGDLWVGDVGQDRYEEVDIVRRGENYGWNVFEGFEPFSNRYRREGETYVAPVFSYRRPYGPCVTGGYVYRGNPKSSFYGVYVFGDYQSSRVFGLTQRDRVLDTVKQIGTAPEHIASFAQDGAGQLYVVGYEGTIYRVDLGVTGFGQ